MARRRKRKAYTLEDIRRKHANAYEVWTQEDDDRLWEQRNRSAYVLSRMFDRRPSAIRSRLRKLWNERQHRQPTPAPAKPNPPESAPPQLAYVLPTLRKPKTVVAQPPPSPAARSGPPAIPPRPQVQVPPPSVPANEEPRCIRRKIGFAVSVIVALVLGFIIGRATARNDPPVVGVRNDGATTQPVARVPAGLADSRITVATNGDDRETIKIATWNIRGYPEKRESDTAWVHQQLSRMGMDVLCIQEIASRGRADELRARDGRLPQVVFADSHQGQGNAILASGRVTVQSMPDPPGFQHPPQVAYVAYKGFDAVVVCLHLTWASQEIRAQEREQLRRLVPR